jgi:hypothetical protein
VHTNYTSMSEVMKKPQQILVTIISLIILTFFVSTSWAYVCVGNYTIDAIDTSSDIADLSDCTEITGSLTIEHTALTSLTGLENLTSVGWDFRGLIIWRNDALASLSGLNNLTSVGGDLYIGENNALTNLCALYDTNFAGDELSIYENTLLSMETAYALETQLRSNGFTGTADIFNNNGSGIVCCGSLSDNDNDLICSNTDNCPDTFNSDQLDADSDGIGDACDSCPNDSGNDADGDGICNNDTSFLPSLFLLLLSD